MAKRVWVIEAPGKKGAFSSSLNEAGFMGDSILATYGRLFDLPEDELGFNPSIIRHSEESTQIKWLPKRPDQVRKLVNLLSLADEVMIATDSDLEGELIASQVYHLCKLAQAKVPSKITTSRVHVRSITPQGITSAFENKTVIHPNTVRAAKARRVMDRILGYQLHDPNDSWRLSLGRVISPVVYSLRENPAESSIVRKKLADGWSAMFRIKSNQESRKEALISILSSLDEPEIETQSVSDVILDKQPLTGAEALSMCMRTLPHPAADIHNAIQKNYEKGKLSYPRSDSRRIEEIGLKWIERMAQQNGVPHSREETMEKQARVLERSHDAHEALLPTTDNIPSVNIELNRMSVEEAVLMVIANHSMKIGSKAQVYRKESASLGSFERNQKWVKSLGGWLDDMEIVRITDADGKSVDPVSFLLEREANLDQGDIQAWEHSVEQIVVERLMQIGLGRPSTLMEIAFKAKSQYLNKNGMVNGRGHIMIEKMMQRLPELLREEVARPLETAITATDENQTIAERLSRAWQILGSPQFAIETGSIDRDAAKISQKESDKAPLSSRINYSNY